MALRIYFDGSGKEDNHPVITVGGYLADAELCERMESELEALTKGRVFHLKNFGTNSCELGSRSWTEEERIQFLKSFAGIVNRPGVCIISRSIVILQFGHAIRKAENPQEIGPAFSACAYACIAAAESAIMKATGMSHEVHYVFESGDRAHEILHVFEDLQRNDDKTFGKRGVSFEPKKTLLLQPADLIAGVVQRCLIQAYDASPKNDLAEPRLIDYDRFYSQDGVTFAVVNGHDQERCMILKASHLSLLDRVSSEILRLTPGRIEKRKQRFTFKPRREKRQ